MTAAYRLKGVGWLIAVVAIVLAFYLVSLRVAEERKRLEAVNAHIAQAQRDIRALETEFDTRANLVQLERWNGDTLALAAPTAGQFVRDAAQLASLDATGGGALVQTAALVVPAAVAVPASTVESAAAVQPALGRIVPAGSTAAPVRVAIVHAALDPSARLPVSKVVAVHAAPTLAAGRALAHLATPARAAYATVKVRPQAIAMLDDKLLSDATLGDLLARAKREARLH